MASEIRANTIKNRVGLSTINISNTGIVVSGISTFSDKSNFNSNVGIGTDSPYTTGAVSNHKLTIKGDDLLGIGRANSDMFYVRREYAAGKYTLQTINGGNDGSFLLQPFGGKIGIGTNNPSQKLDVYGSGTTLINVENSDDGIAGITFANTGSSNWAIKNEDAHLRFQIAGNEKLRITSDGKIGIGTDSPDSDAYIHIVGTDNGKIILEDNDNNGANLRKNYIGIQGSDNLILAADEADLGTSSSIRFRIDNTEKVCITSGGRVGIGTDSPTTRLEIVDSKIKTWTPTTQTELLVERNGNCIVSIVGKNDSNCQLAFGDNDDENAGYIDYDHADNSMAFRTNGSERLRIGSAGQLGIAGANYGTAGQVLKSGGSGAALTWGAGGKFTSYAIVAEVRSGTSDAGTLTANTWMTRAINTEIADPDGIVSISSNQFTLQAGTYLIEWQAPAWRCDRHTTRLYDVTNSAARGNATLEFSQDSGSYALTSSRGFARVTISGATVYKLETKGNVTKSGDGLGMDPNNLASCIYAMAKIYKEV